MQRPARPRTRLFSVTFGATDFVDVTSAPDPNPLQRAILPLVVEINGGFTVEGTAFGIGSGFFLTASHVLTDREQLRAQTADLLFIGGRLPSGALRGGRVPIRRVFIQRETDLALLWAPFPFVDGSAVEHDAVEVDLEAPAVGDGCVAVGYTAQTRLDAEIRPGAISLWIDPRLHASRGVVEEVYLERRGGLLKGPAFQTNARIEHQMSGSPVFAGSGPRWRVKGIVGTGTDLENEREVMSHASLLWPVGALALEIDEENGSVAQVTVRELVERGWFTVDGIAHVAPTPGGANYVR